MRITRFDCEFSPIIGCNDATIKVTDVTNKDLVQIKEAYLKGAHIGIFPHPTSVQHKWDDPLMDRLPLGHNIPKKVIFHDPATIVYWADGTRTVVKCQPGDTYDPEKGLLLCIAKKSFGNNGKYNDILNEYLAEEKWIKVDDNVIKSSFEEFKDTLIDNINNLKGYISLTGGSDE